MRIWIVAAAVALIMVGGAAAQNPNPQAAAEQQRIAKRVHSGAVTGSEAHRLESQQQRIDSTAARERASHNGHLTARQRAALQARQRAASRNIRAKRHNARHY